MEDSRDAFKIPHDLKIFKEVFSCERATRDNDFWKAYDLPKVSLNFTTTSFESENTWKPVAFHCEYTTHRWNVQCGLTLEQYSKAAQKGIVRMMP